MELNNIQIKEKFSEVSTKCIDDRKRITIGDAIDSIFENVNRFKIYKSSNGDVLLRPVVEIPVCEAWLFKNKNALQSVKRGLKQYAKGKINELDESLLAPED